MEIDPIFSGILHRNEPFGPVLHHEQKLRTITSNGRDETSWNDEKNQRSGDNSDDDDKWME